MEEKKNNVVSFISKAKEKGVALKIPPRHTESMSKQLVETDEDVYIFRFQAGRDEIKLYLFESSLLMRFEFYDTETQAMYREYEIDMESFILMEQVVDKAEKMIQGLKE